MQTAKQYLISGQQVQNLINYLGSKPYNEVRQVIPELLALPPVPEEKPDDSGE